MMRDLIAAILVAILVDVSWNAAGMRDPLPERAPITESGSYNWSLPSTTGSAVGAVAQSGAGRTTWWYPGSDPNKQHCFTFDSAGNIVDAGTCAGASQ